MSDEELWAKYEAMAAEELAHQATCHQNYVATLDEAIERLTEERDAARAENANLRREQVAGIEFMRERDGWRARAESAEAALRELRTYVKHPSHECVPVCKCGLTELLRSLNAKA